MLIFDLKCQAGHLFEGWFDSLQALEEQINRALVSCPVCGTTTIQRLVSSFAIGNRKTRGEQDEIMEGELGQSAQLIQQAMQRFLHEKFEDVGTGFFKEALKMHYGAVPVRNIRGISSPQEEEVLREEGVEFFKLDGETVEKEDLKSKKNRPKQAN